MTTIINNPGESEGSGIISLVIGIIIIAILATLFFVYGLPILRGSDAPQQNNGSIDLNVKLPTGGSGETSGN